ncbi:hypothetical protein QTP88_014601 [Uroleucon formosanum]
MLRFTNTRRVCGHVLKGVHVLPIIAMCFQLTDSPMQLYLFTISNMLLLYPLYLVEYKNLHCHRNPRLFVCSMFKLIEKQNIMSLFIIRKKERNNRIIYTRPEVAGNSHTHHPSSSSSSLSSSSSRGDLEIASERRAKKHPPLFLRLHRPIIILILSVIRRGGDRRADFLTLLRPPRPFSSGTKSQCSMESSSSSSSSSSVCRIRRLLTVRLQHTHTDSHETKFRSRMLSHTRTQTITVVVVVKLCHHKKIII